MRAFIERVLPEHKDRVEYSYIDTCNGCDVYEIDWIDDKLVLRGNNKISISAALGFYLKHTAKVNISWCGGNFKLPEKLPKPQPSRHVIEQKYRVYMNYCTFNYSASWWDFKRWEREIDFMALNGINMPLSVVGIEAVWYETLLEFGFDDCEARGFLAGPAFLAWQWMTNLEGFGGPLPKSWIDKRLEMGRKIIARQLELGMCPIQQGFSGYVPKLMKEKFPDADIAVQEKWFGQAPTDQLDPVDPLFRKIGSVFLQKQKELLGSYGYYAADPFHEGAPPQDGDEYLRKVGKSISSLFEEFDADYCWVMQAWSIRKPIATSVPKDRLLILDLNGIAYKDNENFWGYDFVVGNLHNFGGRTKLHGDLGLLSENQYKCIKAQTEHVIGTGLFMEGIGQNPVYYDLAFDMMTSANKTDINQWLKDYALRRYGVCDINAEKAWKILLNTVYAPGTNGVESSSMICARPAIKPKKSGPNEGFSFPYDNRDLAKAYRCLRDVDSDTDGYFYDLVDLMRQILSDYAYKLYSDVSGAYTERDLVKFRRLSKEFTELLDDVDDLLSCREEFSFGKWIEDAWRFADTEEEKDLYDYNATALLTIWGPDDEPVIFDYSWREWSGLISGYYKMRWEMFFDMLRDVLENGVDYTEDNLPLVEGREAWRANEFYDALAECEVSWIRTRKSPVQKNIDTDKILNKLEEKYFACL